MKLSRISLILIILFAVAGGPPVRAQQEEPRAAWQVVRYDITASLGGASGAERVLASRAVLSARNVGEGAGRTFTVRLNRAAEVTAASVGEATARFTTRQEARTDLQLVTLTLPAAVAPGGNINATFDYRLPVAENSGLTTISVEGTQFLAPSYWYPTPNTHFSVRGADYAPVRLTVNGASGDTVVSSGQLTGATFEQALNAQPFFLTSRWETVEGAGEARGISAYLYAGASAEERRRAEAVVAYAGAARAFYAGLLGAAPDVPVRLVSVRRGAGFNMAGTLLVDPAIFRRAKLDAQTALTIAEAVGHLWVGGATAVQGEGSGVVREGLSRFLAIQFFEKQFGRETAETERKRIALLYAPIARRDAPLSQTSPLMDTYFNTVTNKGALVWRLIADRVVGREAFMNMLRSEFAPARAGRVSLASLRAALGERSGEALRAQLQALFDQPTDLDLLVGLPQQRAGRWVSALRNMGSTDAEVTVEAVTESGERLTATARVPAKDFGEAQFQTNARIVRVEVDPEKLYPQIDYSNDTVPRAPEPEAALAEARAALTTQPARAESTAREILARLPQHDEARIVLARALLEQNKIDEAEKEFRAAMSVPLPAAATLAWGSIGLGEVANRRSRPADAVRSFDEAVRADVEYASTLAARAARIKAEAAAGTPSPVDEQVRVAAAQLDAAIRSGRKAELDAVILPGELIGFSKGIVGNQPEQWQTRVLRTESLGTARVAADVQITARVSGRDQAGTAVLVFARTPAGWKLADIQFFEVR